MKDKLESHMKWFLMLHDKTEVFENLYHNQILQKYLDNPEVYQGRYLVRESIENCHGREKRLTEIKNLQANNIKKFTSHIGMHISILTFALVGLQNDVTVTEGFTFRGGLI